MLRFKVEEIKPKGIYALLRAKDERSRKRVEAG